jgi:hypothetical protein
MRRFLHVGAAALVLALVLPDQTAAQPGRRSVDFRSPGVGGVTAPGIAERGDTLRSVGTRPAVGGGVSRSRSRIVGRGRRYLPAGAGAPTGGWGYYGAPYGVSPFAGCVVWNGATMVNTCTGPYAYRYWW